MCVSTGDRVIIYMPMVPEALVAMLACARIGAIHCVVFGGFASKELAVRIGDASPKASFAIPEAASIFERVRMVHRGLSVEHVTMQIGYQDNWSGVKGNARSLFPVA